MTGIATVLTINMSMNNLTIDGEFRYIIQWFIEWSELQRDDFIPIMVDYMTDKTDASLAAPTIVNVNGLQNDVERSLDLNGKPMSLFQCRVKLFNQWNPKWPIDFKEKLQQSITEIDDKVGERIKESLNIKYNGSGNLTNGFAGSNDGHDFDQYLEDTTKDYQHPNGNERKLNDQQQQQQVANEVTNAVTLNDPMQEVLSNETSVDDIELTDDINKPHSGQQQQVTSKETVKDNDNVAHVDGFNEDCTKPFSCIARPNDGNHDDGDQTREPVEQVVQMLNLQINEEDHADVTASAEQPQQQPHTTASSVPVTVTVNPVVVVTAQTLTANAEVPLVV